MVYVCSRPSLSLSWRHNGRVCVSIHRCLVCVFSRFFRRRSKKISKLRVTGLCYGNPPVTGRFPSQRASNAESVSIWWRHYARVFNCSLILFGLYRIACVRTHFIEISRHFGEARAHFIWKRKFYDMCSLSAIYIYIIDWWHMFLQ